MSWTLFIGGIMAGFVAVWFIVEKVKRDTTEYEVPVRETEILEAHEPVYCMTSEEFDVGMNVLFEIFAIKE